MLERFIVRKMYIERFIGRKIKEEKTGKEGMIMTEFCERGNKEDFQTIEQFEEREVLKPMSSFRGIPQSHRNGPAFYSCHTQLFLEATVGNSTSGLLW